jgi:hypothetical protein
MFCHYVLLLPEEPCLETSPYSSFTMLKRVLSFLLLARAAQADVVSLDVNNFEKFTVGRTVFIKVSKDDTTHKNLQDVSSAKLFLYYQFTHQKLSSCPKSSLLHGKLCHTSMYQIIHIFLLSRQHSVTRSGRHF